MLTKLYHLKLRAPILTNDHCFLSIKPKVYSRRAYQPFERPDEIKIGLRYFYMIAAFRDLFSCRLTGLL